MPIRRFPLYGVWFALSLVCASSVMNRSGAESRTPIGARPQELAFADLQGQKHTLRSKETKPSVYLFLGTQCPVANAYTPRLLALAKTYRAQGVRFFGVYSNINETKAEISKHAKERGFSFPTVKDSGALADRLGATLSPEAVLLDGQGAVRYRGRIDDNKDAARVSQRDLQNALDATLAGKPVLRAEAPAFGCALYRGETASTPTRLARVTYARDVAPILQNNCLRCHRTGEVAPFGLETYAQAKTWASAIKTYTANRKMPPWKADSNGEFHNESRLTEKQIATLAEWANGGAPAGDLKQTPKPPTFPVGWELGKPDVVYSMPEKYDVPAEGRDLYQCFVIPTQYAEDKWLSAIEFQPDNRRVVHHFIAYVDTSGKARQLDAADPAPGYTNPTPGNLPGFVPVGFLGAWAPGNNPYRLPKGIAEKLPKGADIVLEVHYHMNGKAEKDQSRFGLHFANYPVEKRVQVGTVINPQFRIPANDSNYTVKAELLVAMPNDDRPQFSMTRELKEDITLHGLAPHMHLIGRTMRVTAHLPDGSSKRLVYVPDWDFNWQLNYRFKTPVKLPKGTRFEVVATYDNSAQNPNNPNSPPKPVSWGEQSTDEMCVAFLIYTLDGENRVRTAAKP